MATQASPVSLTISTERNGDKAVLHCTGRLVSGVCGFLNRKVQEVMPESKIIVLDLTDLEFVDSMGLGTLVRLYVSCKSSGRRLELINLGKRVRELLGLTNLLGLFAEMGEKGITHF
ncbi:MAG TPA: STAS domain-containing protein [Edaphobacter sp.]|jgi:anti-sigma B factor antagonist|nr:STAS domain-containing protein [Edaphobacter sp.]